MDKIFFTCTALKGTGKKGILAPDSDGYYTMPVGALNSFNSNGSYYPANEARSLFESSGALMRRVNAGCLKGELGHPEPLPGENMDAFMRRVMKIDEKNVCVHFRDIWLDDQIQVDDMGRPVVAIMARLTPSGPHAASLERSLNNSQEDVCFSIRSFTEDTWAHGVKQRKLVEVVTWDNVTEPGIATARKYRTPALESLAEHSFTRDDAVKAIQPYSGVGMESSSALVGQAVLSLFGVDLNAHRVPKFIDWK